MCSKNYRCAQCNQSHYSLDAGCSLVQHHRNNRNRAVKQALQNETIRSEPISRYPAPPTIPPALDDKTYPALPTTAATNHHQAVSTQWKTRPNSNNQDQLTDISNQQLLDKICAHMDEKSKGTEQRLNQIEEKTKANKKCITHLFSNLLKLVETLQTLTQEIIQPTLEVNKNSKGKIKEEIMKIKSMLNEQAKSLQNDSYDDDNPMEIQLDIEGGSDEEATVSLLNTKTLVTHA